MGAIRFHTYENEARAIRRQEKSFTVEDNAGENADDSGRNCSHAGLALASSTTIVSVGYLVPVRVVASRSGVSCRLARK